MCGRSWEQFSHKWLGFWGTFFLRQGGKHVVAQGTVRCGSLRWKCAERWFFSWSPRNNWVTGLLFSIASGTSICELQLHPVFPERDPLCSWKSRAVWEPLLYSVGLPPQCCSPCQLGVILKTSLTNSQRPCLMLAPKLLPGVCEALMEGSVHLMQEEGLVQPSRILSSLLATGVLQICQRTHVHILQSLTRESSLFCVCPTALTIQRM